MSNDLVMPSPEEMEQRWAQIAAWPKSLWWHQQVDTSEGVLIQIGRCEVTGIFPVAHHHREIVLRGTPLVERAWLAVSEARTKAAPEEVMFVATCSVAMPNVPTTYPRISGRLCARTSELAEPGSISTFTDLGCIYLDVDWTRFNLTYEWLLKRETPKE